MSKEDSRCHAVPHSTIKDRKLQFSQDIDISDDWSVMILSQEFKLKK